MNKLCIKLPPYAPDYSGVCSALFELDGVVIIHDAAGCTGNYTGYDEPRWYGSQSKIYCSNLRELDAVMGDDEKLIQKATTVAQNLNPNFVAILGSPVPMVVGADMNGIASEIENRLGIPVIGFDTNGLNYYDKGIDSALCAAAKRFVNPAAAKKPKTLNIIGATPLDFSADNTVSDIKSYLNDFGWDVISTFAMGSSLEDFAESASASVNLVVSSSGLGLAKYFKDTHDIPYICGVPIGSGGANSLMKHLSEGNFICSSLSAAQKSDGAKILIIHDQIIANSLRNCLIADYGFSDITVVTPFSFSTDLAQKKDKPVQFENEIEDILNSGFDFIFADPLFEDLLSADSKSRFVDFPHVAVSSKLYWNECVKMVGKNIHNYIAKSGLTRG